MQSNTEKTYIDFFNSLLDCVAIYKAIDGGENFIFEDFNPSAQKLENISREELLGKKITDVFPAVIEFGIFDAIKKVYTTGEAINFPLSFYEDDRISGWRENYIYKLDEDRVVAIYSDITKEKQSEQELKRTLSFLKSYQIAMNESSIVSKTNKEGIITYVNNNFCKISGYTEDEVIGRPHNIIKHDDNPKELFKDLWDTIKSKKIWKKLLKNKAKDGSAYWVDTTILPIVDDKDEIVEYIAVRHDITKMIAQQNSLDKVANTDSLTKLGSRYKLINDIKSSKSPSLAIINLDSFSQINDFYGHEIGDFVIQEFAKILSFNSNIKECELYHIQGDEYVILQDNISKEDFIEKIVELEKELIKTTIEVKEEEFSFNFSMAISFEKKENILSTADMALKIAKKENKSMVIYRDEISLNNEYENNIKWAKKLKEAIQDDNIIPVFQPIINNKTNEIEKYECLVRLKDEDKLISPYFFLDISKKTKQYIHITKTMILKSFETFKDKDKDMEFSINITIEDILNHEIQIFIFNMLKKYDIGSKVVFEIVESESIENFEKISKFIQDIKKFGCKFAIDDFGTGYSNFNYLLKLKPDYLKIDGSLIKDIDTNENTMMVISVIVNFSKKIGMKIIAEFVENESILKKIKELDIEYSQGYYFSAPVENID